MNNPDGAAKVSQMLFRCMGVMVAILFSMAGPVLGKSGGEPAVTPDNQSTVPSEKKTPGKQDSPLIGHGVHTPADIGASGTATTTPPVRTESPTDDPQILPNISPVPSHPSNPETAPIKESEPLGQPNHLKKTPEK